MTSSPVGGQPGLEHGPRGDAREVRGDPRPARHLRHARPGDQPDPTKGFDDRDDCAKTGNQYVVRTRKAIHGYFGPDSTQYPQIGGTRQSDRKTGGRRAKIATLPQAA